MLLRIRRVRALVLAAACAAGCARPSPGPALPDAAGRQIVRVGVSEGGRTRVRSVPLEEYVEAAILSEFAPARGDERVVLRMLEVQAVISRTWTVAHAARHGRDGYDVCDRTHCQLFEPARRVTSRWAPLAAAAVRRTRGRVLWFGGAAARALYHADCGGRTSAADDVWEGTPLPYLVARRDDGPAGRAHGTWVYDVPEEAMRSALNADRRTRVGAALDGIDVLDRDSSGRAARIRLRGSAARTIRADVFREVLAAAFGGRSIRSTWFEVAHGGGRYSFSGRGFGHGVGLCQAGAFARLAAGATPAEVLRRYFPGTRLVSFRGEAAERPRASAGPPRRSPL